MEKLGRDSGSSKRLETVGTNQEEHENKPSLGVVSRRFREAAAEAAREDAQQVDRDDSQAIARHLLSQAILKLGAAAEYLHAPEQAEQARGIAAQAFDLAREVR